MPPPPVAAPAPVASAIGVVAPDVPVVPAAAVPVVPAASAVAVAAAADFADVLTEPCGRFPILRRAWRGLLDLAFPRECAVFGGPVDNPPWRYLSEQALAGLEPVSAPCCATCGTPFFGILDGLQKCPNCEELHPVFRRGKVAVLAHGPARTLVHILKYRQGVWLAQDIARIIAATPGFADFLEGATLVPVPLHPSRQRWRGYNQSCLLAEHVVRLLPGRGLRVDARLARRVRDTRTQTLLGRTERAQNMLGAFALDAGVKLDKATRYVVFDDVFTTGATLNACCVALAAAGAGRVDVAAFAHG
ncbi:MAG: ComF family protein [Puniceicoccales bacterium]|nr:ComF family protein [Puniceicoccales bacterium]